MNWILSDGSNVSLRYHLVKLVISLFILCFANMIDFISSCNNSLHQSEKQRKGWVRWGVDLLRNHLLPNFSEDFSMCHDFMQGLKKIEEVFAQERKVVDDLLGIAKVFCIFSKWHASFVLSVFSTIIHIRVHNLGDLWNLILFSQIIFCQLNFYYPADNYKCYRLSEQCQ